MRTIDQCLKLKSSFSMTVEESIAFDKWLREDARYVLDSCDYCFLLGWYILDDYIPLSPKEAGYD